MEKSLTEIAMMTYQVLDELIDSPQVKALMQAEKSLVMHQQKIEAFRKVKVSYETLRQLYHFQSIELKAIRKELSNVKKEVYELDEVQTYFREEKALQEEINHILTTIGAHISPYIQTPNHRIGGTCGLHK